MVLDPNNSLFSESLKVEHGEFDCLYASNVYCLPSRPVTGRQSEHHRDCVDIALKMAHRFLVCDGECGPPSDVDVAKGIVSLDFVKSLSYTRKISNNHKFDDEFLHSVSWRIGQSSDLVRSDEARSFVKSFVGPLERVHNVLGKAAYDKCVSFIKSQLLSKCASIDDYARASDFLGNLHAAGHDEMQQMIVEIPPSHFLRWDTTPLRKHNEVSHLFYYLLLTFQSV